MRNFRQTSAHTRTGEKSGFWLALVFALSLHGVFLLLPMSMQTPDRVRVPAQIELQLTTIHKEVPVLQELKQTPDEPSEPDSPEPEILPDPLPQEEFVKTRQAPGPPRLIPAPPVREWELDPEKMTQAQKASLTSAILSRQYISEEPVVDKIFGRPIESQATEPQREFHYPARQNMMTMLDQPMQDLPFAYEPGLIYFAYDPGVRGDLQRFWDVITPEFGWRTDNGTEFKCKWILIIAACGWK